MGKVSPIKLTARNAARLIAKLAKNTESIIFINDCANGDWERRVNYHQALLCLREGDMLGDPTYNEETACWECRMRRFNAGQDIVIDVVIQHDRQKLYVLNVCER